VSPTNEAKAIGVCTRTIFERKNLTRGSFTCKRNRSVQISRLRKRTIKNGKK
jgi:hypothetical protein